MTFSRILLFLSLATGMLAATFSSVVQDEKKEVKVADPGLELARREVRLLDDMYKTAIVLITKHYVNSDDDLPAGDAFKQLFANMQENGWHEVKLLDATGDPINDDNEPKKGFEQTAVKALVGGKTMYEEVIVEDGKRFLRAATAIPVVMEKCTMCHDNYKDLPKGKAIGAIGYKLPILDDAKYGLKPLEKPESNDEK